MINQLLLSKKGSQLFSLKLLLIYIIILFSKTALAESPTANDAIPINHKVRSIDQLKDISPDHWAYEALQTLIERYHCLNGYPTQTFQGNRNLTRWEFAAGLNACFYNIEQLLFEQILISKEDSDRLNRLKEEFKKELAILNNRLSNLETRISFLEAQSFSTTTLLNGETIVTLSGVSGNETASLSQPSGTPLQDGQNTLNYRTRLVWDTSFQGRDQLRIRMQIANLPVGRGGTNLTDYNFVANTNNKVTIQKLQYRFPMGEKANIWVSGTNFTLYEVTDPLAPFTNSETTGSISAFGAFAPIYFHSENSGPGLGASYILNKKLSLAAYYSAGQGFSTQAGQGLFNGQYTTGMQLTYRPTSNTGLGLAYVHSYYPQGFNENFSVLAFLGVSNTDAPFGSNATSADNLALMGTWQINSRFSVEGWGMYTKAYANGGERKGDQADIWNWKISFAFPDLGTEGNLGVITVGNPPYASRITNRHQIKNVAVATLDVPWFIEGFYVFQLNDTISVTPGIFTAINPENGRDPLVVTTLRFGLTF